MTDESGSPVVRHSRDGAVSTLIIDAPKLRNSLGAPGVRPGLIAAIEQFEADASARIMVVHGAGGTFSAGGNLNDLKTLDHASIKARLADGGRIFEWMLGSSKLYVAAVEGPAYGAGLGLALACDIVIAADTARFCAAHVKVGAIPDAALFWTLPKRVGWARAKRLMLTGEEVGASAAVDMGLADERVPAGQALVVARQRAATLASGPPLAQAAIKATSRELPADMAACLAMERERAADMFVSEDFREGAAAFLEKRAPRFKGR